MVKSLPLGALIASVGAAIDRFGGSVGGSANKLDPDDDAALAGMFSSLPDPNAALHFYRAYRFYRRAARDITEQYQPIDASVVHPRPAPPPPNFHRLVAMLGDHSTLLRKLGLVIDYRVSRDHAYPTSGRMQIAVNAQTTILFTSSFPSTAYRFEGAGFYADSNQGDDVELGLLVMGPESGYQVVQVDVDGGALKTVTHATNFAPILAKAAKAQAAAPRESLPSRRTGGFTIARYQRREKFVAQLARAAAQNDALTGNAPVVMFADGVTRGYRLDAEVDGAW